MYKVCGISVLFSSRILSKLNINPQFVDIRIWQCKNNK